MTNPCGSLDAAFEELRGEYRCVPAADQRSLLVTTGRYYGDGDAVEVVVRFSADGRRVAVSDGGLTRARRDGFTSVDLSRGSRTFWTDIVAEFGVAEIDDRVYVRGTASDAAQLISQVADASIALDSVKLLTEQERVTFASRLERWLRVDAQVTVAESKVVTNRYNEPQQVTAVVEADGRRIAVQGAGGQTAGAVRSAAEHAHWVFSGLDLATWPIENRLVVLERTGGRRTPSGALGLVSRLSEVAYVGSFESQIAVRRFLLEAAPADRDLVNVPFGQTSMEEA